jgi:N-acyl-L-homoserine lactone synthetase
MAPFGRPARPHILDAYASRLVAAASPVRFSVAGTDREREECFRLRGRVVVERGWGRPEDLRGGMERDAFDDRAIHVVGRLGSRTVATGRLVLPWAGVPLPTEAVFGITIEPAGAVADFGRNAFRTPTPGTAGIPESRLLMALIAKGWLELRSRGCSRMCGTLSPGMVRLYRRIGTPVRVLGPPRTFFGEERLPIRFDGEVARPPLQRAVPPTGGDRPAA